MTRLSVDYAALVRGLKVPLVAADVGPELLAAAPPDRFSMELSSPALRAVAAPAEDLGRVRPHRRPIRRPGRDQPPAYDHRTDPVTIGLSALRTPDDPRLGLQTGHPDSLGAATTLPFGIGMFFGCLRRGRVDIREVAVPMTQAHRMPVTACSQRCARAADPARRPSADFAGARSASAGGRPPGGHRRRSHRA